MGQEVIDHNNSLIDILEGSRIIVTVQDQNFPRCTGWVEEVYIVDFHKILEFESQRMLPHDGKPFVVKGNFDVHHGLEIWLALSS
jgi:hypothetical protein